MFSPKTGKWSHSLERRLIQLDGDCLKATGDMLSPGGGAYLQAELQAAAPYLWVVGQVDLPGDVVYCTNPLQKTKERSIRKPPTTLGERLTVKALPLRFLFCSLPGGLFP